MDWTWYLFRFDGRINRAKYWLAALIILCWMIFLAGLTVAAGLVSGGEVSFDTSDLFRVIDPTSYKSLSWPGLPALLIKMIGTPLFLWVYFATSIKRLHDRERLVDGAVLFHPGPLRAVRGTAARFLSCAAARR